MDKATKFLSKMKSIIDSRLPKSVKQGFKRIKYQTYYELHTKKQGIPEKTILILAHERSGSSLLAQLLNTTSEITGIGEARILYQSMADLKTLIGKIDWELGKTKKISKYVFDKLVSNGLPVPQEILNNDRVYVIFLVRGAERTLSSMLKSGFHLSWGEPEALECYCSRLLALENYARTINDKKRTLFLTYEHLVNQTKLVLTVLEEFLELQEPLSENYGILPTTGKKGTGDLSENIKLGYIIKTHKNPEGQISSEYLEAGNAAFDKCCATLSEYCTVAEN